MKDISPEDTEDNDADPFMSIMGTPPQQETSIYPPTGELGEQLRGYVLSREIPPDCVRGRTVAGLEAVRPKEVSCPVCCGQPLLTELVVTERAKLADVDHIIEGICAYFLTSFVNVFAEK